MSREGISRERIEAILRRHPGGLSRAEIGEALRVHHGEDAADRTLRRRLEAMEGDGIVRRTGRSRAIRYHATASTVPGPHTDEVPETGTGAGHRPEAGSESPIPLSPAGAEVRRLVRQPRQRRQPCTYDREFLESYLPGETWYLSEAVRTELMASGETPTPERPAGTYARDILDQLLIDLSWASSRLEGNTYTRLDTQNLLEHGVLAEGKGRHEAQMVLNHRAAIRLLVDHVDQVGLDRRTLLAVHAALAENLVGSPGDEGALRQRPVDIGNTVYRPSAVPQIIRECFDLLLEKARAIPDPFEQAFFAMVHIPYLQPFVDVNKRTSRIVANIPFIKNNLTPLSFVDVPHDIYLEATIGMYEKQDVALLRDLFVWAYQRSAAQYRVVRAAMGEPDDVRLRYRDQLGDVIRQTIKARAAVERGPLSKWASEHDIAEDRRAAFVERAMEILLNLTEGAAARYGLSPEDVDAWRAAMANRGLDPQEPYQRDIEVIEGPRQQP